MSEFATSLLLILLTSVVGAGQYPATPAKPGPGELDRSQARSMVISRDGIVASEQPLASQAGAIILARGGSAADAAIATNAVMGLIEPMMNGVGGDLFAIEWDAKTNRLTGLNASGWAPEKLTPAFLRGKGFTRMPSGGIYSVTVPGCVEGWWKLHQKFGRLPWAELFQPAIYYATHGFPVPEWDSAYWKAYGAKLSHNPEASRVFLPGGKTPAVGEVFRNPEYGKALELIASQGEAAFYRGAIARAILKTSDDLGGVMTAQDLSAFQAQWVDPISTTYRGWTIYELPPNGQGMAALEMLNIMERFPIGSYGPLSPQRFHVEMEAQRLAYADLFRYLGDPRFVKVSVAGLISKPYAAARAKLIDPSHAHCNPAPGAPPGAAGFDAGSPPKPGPDTNYLTVVDSDGNIVSLIQSLSAAFGSGIAVEGYGIILQNRGAGFVLDPSSPDVLARHKRPFHTIIPAFMEKGDLHIGFGIMGGLNQPQAHAQFVSDIADFGMNIQAALEFPRFTKLNHAGCDFVIENRVPQATLSALVRMGHVLEVKGPYDDMVGGGQAVEHDSATGVNYGASDPRKDGEAIPQPGSFFHSKAAGRRRVRPRGPSATARNH
ncbi:MAG: gamma-glutamyltransferase [Acidobacteriota bacterium]|nr:gamma-glutamyltransferase [Acidobacteriota bacterium]